MELLHRYLTMQGYTESCSQRNELTNIPVMSMVPLPWGSKRSKAVFMSLVCTSVSFTWTFSPPSFSLALAEEAGLRELEA